MIKLANQSGFTLMEKVKRSELNSIKSFLYMSYSGDHGNKWHPDICSTAWVDYLRHKGWGYKLEGLTAVPPFECFQLCRLDNPVDCDKDHPQEVSTGYIRVRIDQSLTPQELKSSNSIGGYSPYIGSATQEKTTNFGKDLAKVNPSIISRPLGLMKLLGWATEENSSLGRLIKHLLSIVTDYPPEGLAPERQDIVGTLHHRINDTRTGHGGCISLLYTHFTKFQYNSSLLEEYAKGSSNTNLMFQALFVFFGSLISTDLSLVRDPPPTYHIHLIKKCCIQDVNEDLITGSEVSWELLLPPPRIKTPFNWLPSDQVKTPMVLSCWNELHKKNVQEDTTKTLAMMVSETSMKILRRHFCPDPGDLRPEIGRMPFNLAIRTPFLVYIHCLIIRLISFFLSCKATGDPWKMELHHALLIFLDELPASGFIHLDTFLNVPRLLDYCVMTGLSRSGIPDPNLSRPAVGVFFSQIVKTLMISIIRTPMKIKINSFHSVSSCPLDQHPIMLGLAQLFIESAPIERPNIVSLYQSTKANLLLDRRNPDCPSRVTIGQTHLEAARLMNQTICSRWRSLTEISTYTFCDLDPEGYCKEVPVAVLDIPETEKPVVEYSWQKSIMMLPENLFGILRCP